MNDTARINPTVAFASDAHQAAIELERRRAERFPVNTGTACTYVLTVADEAGPTKIRDISTDGIGLVLSQPVEPNQLLVVRLTNKNRQIRLTQLVHVVHCTREGGYYVVGGNFVEPLTYEELSSFVI